jgi:phosphate transport system permease protein
LTAAPLQQTASLKRPLTRGERIDLPRRLTLGSAALVVVVVVLLLLFITLNGIALFTASHVPLDRVLSPVWQPAGNVDISAGADYTFGLIPFIAGTLSVMLLAAVISTPLSIGLALFMAEVAPDWARAITRPTMEVFVGIPSVVWGWVGITVLVPFLRDPVGFRLGFSMLAGGLVLSIMILPTITSVAYDALRAVPADLRSASLSMGTTRWQTIRHVLIPACSTGLVTAIVLGMMRAAGEALAVQMVIGNAPRTPLPELSGINWLNLADLATVPGRIAAPLREPMTTLTSQITMDMGNTVSGEAWNQVLWLMGVVLLAISLIFVLIVRRLTHGRQIG